MPQRAHILLLFGAAICPGHVSSEKIYLFVLVLLLTADTEFGLVMTHLNATFESV